MLLKMAPIVLSCIALVVSLVSAYFQWFRRSLKGRVSVLSISCRYNVEKNVDMPVEVSVSNQGNKPFIISKVWLLHETPDQHRRYLECNEINGSNPLKVMPNSVELKRLNFSQGYQEFHNDLEGHIDTYIEILFYIVDDLGTESYISLKPAITTVGEKKLKKFESLGVLFPAACCEYR